LKIDNEFDVSVPIERAWEVLTDLEGLAPCLPGAQLTGVEGEVYNGKVKVKVGPVISQFAGTARFVEMDEAAHHAVISAKGKDARGGGNASAVIEALLRPDGTRTVVTVTTNLNISGKLAQFGSGMIKEISEKLLNQFVQNLEARLHQPQESAPGTVPETATPTTAAAAAGATVAEAPARETTEDTAPPATAPEAATSEAPVEETAGDTTPAATTAGPEPAATTPGNAPEAAQPQAPAAGSRRPARQETEAEPLDLMGLAGRSVYKRLIPAAVVGIILIALIVFLIVR
jgi:carbon monoxide dehydrogenase subunit G